MQEEETLLVEKDVNTKQEHKTVVAEEFEAVLMDWKTPIMNGLEATLKIGEFDQSTPIIAVTASAFEVNKLRILEAGGNALGTKPLKRQDLLDALNKFL